MSEVSSAQCPVQRECKAAPPVEHSTSAVVKYTEESAPMRLGDAVDYFGLNAAMVFLVSEGAYNAKEREAVATGEDCKMLGSSSLKGEVPRLWLLFSHCLRA